MDGTLGGYSIAEHHSIRAWDSEESGCSLGGHISRTKDRRYIPHGEWWIYDVLEETMQMNQAWPSVEIRL